MLEANGERLVELADDVQGGVGILDVIVRQFLAVQLLGGGQRIWHRLQGLVELGLLMRVLTVAEILADVIFKEQLLRKTGLGAHICGDGAVIFSGVGVGLGREFETGLRSRVTGCLDLGDDSGIVLRIDYHCDRGPVLGSAAKH